MNDLDHPFTLDVLVKHLLHQIRLNVLAKSSRTCFRWIVSPLATQIGESQVVAPYSYRSMLCGTCDFILICAITNLIFCFELAMFYNSVILAELLETPDSGSRDCGGALVLELLVRSYYQFNTASCSKLRSEVWSGNLKYCAGRLHGNRLCRTFFFFCKVEIYLLGWKDSHTHLLFQPTTTNTKYDAEIKDPLHYYERVSFNLDNQILK